MAPPTKKSAKASVGPSQQDLRSFFGQGRSAGTSQKVRSAIRSEGRGFSLNIQAAPQKQLIEISAFLMLYILFSSHHLTGGDEACVLTGLRFRNSS